MKNEEWRDLKDWNIDFTGLYRISSLGRIRRLPKAGRIGKDGIILQHNLVGEVQLYKDGRCYKRTVRSLLKATFGEAAEVPKITQLPAITEALKRAGVGSVTIVKIEKLIKKDLFGESAVEKIKGKLNK